MSQLRTPGSPELPAVSQHLKELILASSSVEERLHGLSPEARLHGLSLEERLLALSATDRAQLIKLLLAETRR